MTTDTASPASILRQAAMHIRVRGHCQGRYEQRPEDGHGVCVFGALNLALVGSPSAHGRAFDHPAFESACKALRSALGLREVVGETVGVVAWNDRTCCTVDDAVNALERAAEIAEVL